MNEIVLVDFDIITWNLQEGYYRCIGSGSGRRVFDLENGYVVKVAKNKKGIAQNEAEFQIALENCQLFASISQASYDFDFVIMEKAEPLIHFTHVWSYYKVKSHRELFRNEELQLIFKKHDLLPVDLYKLSNWGMIDNRPVVIDYGFTKLIKKKYYMPF